MSLFSDLTNIYDNDLNNIHGMEVFFFINRNKNKVDEIDKNITAEFISKNKKINTLTTANYQKAYQISKLKKETLQKDQRIAELEEENAKLQEQLKKAKPKFKYHQIVYAVANADILKGQIEVFDLYKKEYLVYFYGIDDVNCLGDEWCYKDELFDTEAEARKYLEKKK